MGGDEDDDEPAVGIREAAYRLDSACCHWVCSFWMVNCNMQVQLGSHKLKRLLTLVFSLPCIHVRRISFPSMPKLEELEVRDQGALIWLRCGAPSL